MEAEAQSRQSAKSLSLSEGFVFVVCEPPFAHNAKPHDVYTYSL